MFKKPLPNCSHASPPVPGSGTEPLLHTSLPPLPPRRRKSPPALPPAGPGSRLQRGDSEQGSGQRPPPGSRAAGAVAPGGTRLLLPAPP